MAGKVVFVYRMDSDSCQIRSFFLLLRYIKSIFIREVLDSFRILGTVKRL